MASYYAEAECQNKTKLILRCAEMDLTLITPRTALAGCRRNNNGSMAPETTRQQRDFLKSFNENNQKLCAKNLKTFFRGRRKTGVFTGLQQELGDFSGHKIR